MGHQTAADDAKTPFTPGVRSVSPLLSAISECRVHRFGSRALPRFLMQPYPPAPAPTGKIAAGRRSAWTVMPVACRLWRRPSTRRFGVVAARTPPGCSSTSKSAACGPPTPKNNRLADAVRQAAHDEAEHPASAVAAANSELAGPTSPPAGRRSNRRHRMSTRGTLRHPIDPNRRERSRLVSRNWLINDEKCRKRKVELPPESDDSPPPTGRSARREDLTVATSVAASGLVSTWDLPLRPWPYDDDLTGQICGGTCEADRSPRGNAGVLPPAKAPRLCPGRARDPGAGPSATTPAPGDDPTAPARRRCPDRGTPNRA